MRESKFRYRLKLPDGTVRIQILVINMIEATIFAGYEILSRDQYTGLKDKDGVEIYKELQWMIESNPDVTGVAVIGNIYEVSP